MASASNRKTLTADGTTAFVKFIGPVAVSMYGAFLGGTAKVQRKDSTGATVDVAGTSKTAAADIVLDFPPKSVNLLAVNLASATPTSPLTSFVVEITDNETRFS